MKKKTSNTKTPSLLTTKDFLVSGETFHLQPVGEFGLLKTMPEPKSEELEKYYKSDAYISHTDSKKTVMDQLYQAVKKIAIRQKIKQIKKASSTVGKVLDVGAGTGDFLYAAKKSGWDIYGSEPSGKARSLAKEKGVFLENSLEQIPQNKMDCITFWHVLEHIPDFENALEMASRKVIKSGVVILALPNYKSYDAFYYKEFWAAYDVPRHLWHFNKEAVAHYAKKYNLELQEIKPMWFDAFYVSLLSEKYRYGKSNWFRAFFIGLRSNFYGIRKKEFSSHLYILKKT